MTEPSNTRRRRADPRPGKGTAGPRIMALGPMRAAAGVKKTLAGIGLDLVVQPDLDGLFPLIDDQTALIMVLHPLDNQSTVAAVKHIRIAFPRRTLPLHVLARSEIDRRTTRALYEAGVTAVHRWPREKKDLLRAVVLTTGLAPLRKRVDADRMLARRVRERLRQAGPDPGGELTVDAVEGIVFLRGQIDALWKEAALTRVAEQVQDVHQVVTRDLEVAPSGIPDPLVRRSVETMMESTSEIDPSTIAVSVSDGVVNLAGSVGDRREMRRLQDLLSNVRGVRRINNLTTISPGARDRDRAVSRAARKILAVHFPREQVEVTIFGDVAVLEGLVSNNVARLQLHRMLEGHGGIQQVVDKLRVRRQRSAAMSARGRPTSRRPHGKGGR